MYLKVWAAALALVIVVGSCKDDNKLPAIDGYNNSDEVAATNLVAHWTFDDNNNEVKSGTAPTKTVGTVSTTTGKIGNAIKLDGGAVVYPPIAAINTVDALNSFSVSLWVNVKGTKGGSNGFTSFFGIIPTSTDFWGNIQACAETSRHLPTSDTVELKNYMNTTTATNAQRGEDNVALHNNDAAGSNANAQTGKYFLGGKDWFHYVMVWDPTSHMFYIYANGESVGGYTNRGDAPVMKMQVPAMAVIGSMASSDLGFPNATRPDWAPLANASIDDIRVYNNVLSQAEVTALYNLGTAGR